MYEWFIGNFWTDRSSERNRIGDSHYSITSEQNWEKKRCQWAEKRVNRLGIENNREGKNGGKHKIKINNYEGFKLVHQEKH